MSHKLLCSPLLQKNGTLSNDIWICDSGAFGHYYKSMEGMFNMSDIDQKIILDNGNSMTATKVSLFNLMDLFWTSQSTKLSMCLSCVLISSAFSLRNKDTYICLTKGSASIIFDRVINTMSGTILGIKMIEVER
jgi:hypothetical protein